MALVDHLRELRARLVRSALVLVAAFIVALFFYDQLAELIAGPYRDAQEQVKEKVDTQLIVRDAAGGLLLQLKLCGVAAVIASSPFWIYQIWAFIVPGLHDNEKKWSQVVALVAGPLFLAGVALGYYVLPKGLAVLINFVPEGVENLVDFSTYFSFVTRMLLIFGVAMELPFFVILLNLAGMVSGRTLGRHRPWIVVGTFMFAAIATPSTDPFSMLMLAIPLVILFMIAEVVARLIDRARGRRDAGTEQWSDDEASTL